MAARVVDRDLGWGKMMALVKEIESARVKVGVLDEGDGAQQHAPGSPLTTAEVAIANEFGTETIPARSFARSTFDRERETLVGQSKIYVGLILDGKMTVPRAMGLLGAHLANAMKRSITDGPGIAPPNAPSTVRRKLGRGGWKLRSGAGARGLGRALAQVGRAASVRTLVDTGRMVGAITWALVSGEK